jgi:hypothetical protein
VRSPVALALEDQRTYQAFIDARIFETPDAYELVEDWSRVRSPGRARRRMARGHRQNIQMRAKPSAFSLDGGRTFYVHPEIVAEMRKDRDR